MKFRIQITAVLCILCMLFSAVVQADESNSMREDGYSSSYSYTYDYWGDVQISPDPYRVARILDYTALDSDKLDNIPLNRPQGFFIRNKDLYLADSGNNRIIQIRCEDYQYQVINVIREFSGDENGKFSGPTDLFVDEEENLYVADYGNHRVIMLDKDLNLVKKFDKPKDSTFNQDSDFLPSKITVDDAGRLYVLAVNVNKGFLKYESDTTFTGYIGANTVKVNMTDYIWKRYFMTAEQRAATESFVPTEYENLAIDDKGFIYATTTVFNEYELMSDTAKPIRRLNSLGNDILIKNDRYPPIGDLNWKEGSIQYGPSRFADITSFENEIYIALDRTRGRLFGYDSQGVMLWAFGTKGNQDGSFNHAIALDRIGYDLYVLDDQKNSITVFTPTEYGQMIYDAVETYLDGRYEDSAVLWNQVLKLNANYPLAFRGIGRSLMREERYHEAMDYFKRAHDREDYGRAFKQYRKIWIEQNVGWIVLILAALLIIPLILGRIRRTKWEVIMYEQSKVRQ